MRIVRRAGVAVAALLLLSAAGCAHEDDAGDPGDQEAAVRVVGGPEPSPDLAGVDQADDELRHELAELVDFHSEDLAGEYVEPDGTIVVVVATPEGEQLVREVVGGRPGVRLEAGPVSLEEAQEAGMEWWDDASAAGTHLVSLGLDPEATELVIRSQDRPSGDSIGRLTAIVEGLGIGAVIYVDEDFAEFTFG